MSESPVKESLRELAEQAVQRIADEVTLEYFSGAIALYDTRRDEMMTELPAFEHATTALGSLSLVEEHYGADESSGLTLQFVYGFLGNLSAPTFDPDAFESTWRAFWEELSKPEWTWLGLANLTNFHTESKFLDLGDGVTIRGRSFKELALMGWSEWHLKELSKDWEQSFGASSSHVILTEQKLPKTPDNFVLIDSTVYGKSARALLALRLLKDGDITMGRMWLLRPVSFNLGLGSGSSMGFPASRGFGSGNAYSLEEAELSVVRDLYGLLLRYEATGDRAPVNVNLALRSFSDVYERRDQWRDDTRLVDAITAAEALLGTSDEVTFRLAFRVAAILGSDDDERVRFFELMKGYYDTRSRVVHGGSNLFNKQGQLKDKPRWHLENQQDLRDFVRRLLVGFIRLSVSEGHAFDESFFRNSLDSALLHDARRSDFRAAMGFGT